MTSGAILERARDDAGLTQRQLAALAGTSRTTLSAYEHGRKSPTLSTAERLLRATGHELHAEPIISFSEVDPGRGRPFFVPDQLWRLPVGSAVATVTLPLTVDWSSPEPSFDLADRRQRARCYEILLQEGMPEHLRELLDGALLVDLWNDLVLPRAIRTAWQPVIAQALA